MFASSRRGELDTQSSITQQIWQPLRLLTQGSGKVARMSGHDDAYKHEVL